MGFRVDVTKKDLGWKALLERVKQLKQDKTFTKAGVLKMEGAQIHPESTKNGGFRHASGVTAAGNLRFDKQEQKPGHLTNIELAVIHEFGAPAANIPERSFLRSTFQKHKAEYREMLRKLLSRSVVHGETDLTEDFAITGQRLAADVKATFTEGEGIPPPLKQETIDRKGSSRPLVDTGILKNSITYAVVKGGGE